MTATPGPASPTHPRLERKSESKTITRRDWVAFALAAVAIPTPLASFYVTFSYFVGTDLGTDTTAAIVIVVVSGAFSLVLIASLLTNAVIIASRMLRRNSWHASRPQVAVQVALLASIALWAASLAGAYDSSGGSTFTLTLVSASAIVILSISIFVFSVMPAGREPQAADSGTL